MSDKVSLELTKEEALVLFEFLWRWNEEGKREVEDKSEEVVLNQIHGLLEKQLVEPFKDDYKKLLEDARTVLKKRAGYQDNE